MPQVEFSGSPYEHYIVPEVTKTAKMVHYQSKTQYNTKLIQVHPFHFETRPNLNYGIPVRAQKDRALCASFTQHWIQGIKKLIQLEPDMGNEPFSIRNIPFSRTASFTTITKQEGFRHLKDSEARSDVALAYTQRFSSFLLM